MIKVKEWIASQIKADMSKYHWMPVYNYNTINGIEQTYNPEDDSYTFIGKVVAESEKAYKVELEAQTENFSSVKKPFTKWIPKSQVINIA